MSRREIPADTRDKQHLASRPRSSAWVIANAGSGKTHVLTQRVVRLLLDGVPASKLLCLTFTKAAAANMSLRVFDTLARWTTLDDGELRAAIAETGAEFEPGMLRAARNLFTRTMETPGGLKIQTIHGFCESILHLFPFEANVPVGFEVVDDATRADLLNRAKAESFAAARLDPALGGALKTLADRVGEADFAALLDDVLRRAPVFDAMSRAAAEWPAGYAALLAPTLGLGADETRTAIETRIVDRGLARADLSEIAATLDRALKTDVKMADRVRAALAAVADERAEAYLEIFFKNREPRGSEKTGLVTKQAQKLDPGLLERLEAEARRLAPLIDKLRAMETVERGQLLVVMCDHVARGYARLKKESGGLDFDDLIEGVARLLARCEASWVLYKLDSGIDHILVDEAQDTSRRQWEILTRLSAEFTSGEGASRAARTFFAVGDDKQSIFSFQGAEPRLFDQTRRAFDRRHREAGKSFESVKLTLSFRSSPRVLSAVDDVFASRENRAGVSSEDVAFVHQAWKRDLPGFVEIWEKLGPGPDPAKPDWLLPLDSPRRDEPALILADRIAALTKRLLDPASGERVFDDHAGGTRPVRGGDIMILLRRRGALFEALIRALKQKNLPVAGADRLVLKDHIAVMDLLALGRFCMLPEDDLSLACVLKSPLIGLDDDDLLAVAPDRKGSLFDALRQSEQAEHRAAADKLDAWRSLARAETPFAFYSEIVEAREGRALTLARLGPEAGDALDEFLRLALAREGAEPPSLLRLIEHIESGDLEVKRDMDAAGASIRVMTVHASKGLEAKIVLLPDTCAVPTAHFDPKLYELEGAGGATALAWSPRAADDCAVVAAARVRAREDMMSEYRRLLYVAMTRAEQRLYIMGCHGPRPPSADCWHEMVWRAIGDKASPYPSLWNPEENVWRLADGFEAESAAAVDEFAANETSADWLPDWVARKAAPEAKSPRAARPSASAAGKASAEADAPTAGADVGTLMHALLRDLPAVDEADRVAFADRFLKHAGVGISPAARATLAADALATVSDPRLAPLFGADAIAEAPVEGSMRDAAGAAMDFSGRIDRLARVGDEIWFADFKTGWRPDVPIAYRRQIAIYAAALTEAFPGSIVRAFLVWTKGPVVVEFAKDDLARHLVADA